MKRILAMALASAAGLAFMTTPVNAASKPNMVIGQRQTLQKAKNIIFTLMQLVVSELTVMLSLR